MLALRPHQVWYDQEGKLLGLGRVNDGCRMTQVVRFRLRVHCGAAVHPVEVEMDAATGSWSIKSPCTDLADFLRPSAADEQRNCLQNAERVLSVIDELVVRLSDPQLRQSLTTTKFFESLKNTVDTDVRQLFEGLRPLLLEPQVKVRSVIRMLALFRARRRTPIDNACLRRVLNACAEAHPELVLSQMAKAGVVPNAGDVFARLFEVTPLEQAVRYVVQYRPHESQLDRWWDALWHALRRAGASRDAGCLVSSLLHSGDAALLVMGLLLEENVTGLSSEAVELWAQARDKLALLSVVSEKDSSLFVQAVRGSQAFSRLLSGWLDSQVGGLCEELEDAVAAVLPHMTAKCAIPVAVALLGVSSRHRARLESLIATRGRQAPLVLEEAMVRARPDVLGIFEGLIDRIRRDSA